MARLESLLLRATLEGQLDERERIARELHDTLLQSAHGLLLRIQGVAGQLPHVDPRRAELESALDQAGELIQETRERVSNLRSSHLASDLPTAIDRAVKFLGAGSSSQCRLIMSGTPSPLQYSAAIHLYSIVREALANAFAHAQAPIIHVEIAFQRSQLLVSIRDSGRGFDAERNEAKPHAKHYGLQGMRERARELGAQIEICSAEGKGTSIRLTLPAAAVYRHDTAIPCESPLPASTRLDEGFRSVRPVASEPAWRIKTRSMH